MYKVKVKSAQLRCQSDGQWAVNKGSSSSPPTPHPPLPLPPPPSLPKSVHLLVQEDTWDWLNGCNSIKNIPCHFMSSNATKELDVGLKCFNFCDLQQETISLSSLPVFHTIREWQKDLTLEHTMCFAEPVLGGTRGHGRDPSQGRRWGLLSALALPCLGATRRGRAGKAGVVSRWCWSLETFSSARVHAEPCWQWCLSTLYSQIFWTSSYNCAIPWTLKKLVVVRPDFWFEEEGHWPLRWFSFSLLMSAVSQILLV